MERSGVKERTVDNALRALRERKIIYAKEGVRGEYRLPTKSFAAWIKAREAARLRGEIGHSPPNPSG